MPDTLPDDLFPPTEPPTQPPGRLMYVYDVLKYLYPKFFDQNDPSHIDDDKIRQAIVEATEARPMCLNEYKQRYAHAYYTAYLLEQLVAEEGGGGAGVTSGIVLSEKEGDVSITYANPLAMGKSEEDLPPQSAWEKWKRLHELCKYGAITTRYATWL